jgi:hypothetical protein
MWAATFGRFAMPSNWSNVSRAVVLRCAVQMTVRPGLSRHSAKMMQAIRYVLPTWRGMLMLVVSAAYEPSARFDRISGRRRPASRRSPSRAVAGVAHPRPLGRGDALGGDDVAGHLRTAAGGQ